jgi:hypothetical protein
MIVLPKRMLIVSYELKAAAVYTKFYEVLKQQGAWSHYIPSTWLIVTTKTPNEVFEAISLHIQPGDLILIATLGDGYWGALPKTAWDWIKEQGLAL